MSYHKPHMKAGTMQTKVAQADAFAVSLHKSREAITSKTIYRSVPEAH